MANEPKTRQRQRALLAVGLAAVVVLAGAIAFVGLPFGQVANDTDGSDASVNNNAVVETGDTGDSGDDSDASDQSSQASTESDTDSASADERDDPDTTSDDSAHADSSDKSDDSDRTSSDKTDDDRQSSNSDDRSNTGAGDESNTGDESSDSTGSDDSTDAHDSDESDDDTVESVRLAADNAQELTVTNPNEFAVEFTYDWNELEQTRETVTLDAGETITISTPRGDSDEVTYIHGYAKHASDGAELTVVGEWDDEPRTSVDYCRDYDISAYSDAPGELTIENPNNDTVEVLLVTDESRETVLVEAHDTKTVSVSLTDADNGTVGVYASVPQYPDSPALDATVNRIIADDYGAVDVPVESHDSDDSTEEFGTVELTSERPEQITLQNPNDFAVEIAYGWRANNLDESVTLGAGETKMLDVERDDSRQRVQIYAQAMRADDGAFVPVEGDDTDMMAEGGSAEAVYGSTYGWMELTVDDDTPVSTADEPASVTVDYDAKYSITVEDSGWGVNVTNPTDEDIEIWWADAGTSSSVTVNATETKTIAPYRSVSDTERALIAVTWSEDGSDYLVNGENGPIPVELRSQQDVFTDTAAPVQFFSDDCGQLTVTNPNEYEVEFFYGTNGDENWGGTDMNSVSLGAGETTTVDTDYDDDTRVYGHALADYYAGTSIPVDGDEDSSVVVDACTDYYGVTAYSDEPENVTVENTGDERVNLTVETFLEEFDVTLESGESETISVELVSEDGEQVTIVGVTEDGDYVSVNGEVDGWVDVADDDTSHDDQSGE